MRAHCEYHFIKNESSEGLKDIYSNHYFFALQENETISS